MQEGGTFQDKGRAYLQRRFVVRHGAGSPWRLLFTTWTVLGLSKMEKSGAKAVAETRSSNLERQGDTRTVERGEQIIGTELSGGM